jgi:hypothetical protein
MTKLGPADVKAVLLRFLVGAPDPQFFSGFEPWEEQTTPVALIVRAFRYNLQSAISVGEVPFKLIHSGVQQRRFGHLVTAETIRQRNFEDKSEPDRDRDALQIARARFAEKEQEADFQDSVRDEVVNQLAHSLADVEFNPTTDELLRQVAVMVWGAFEVVTTDLAKEVLNCKPALANDVMKADAFRQTGLSKGIPVDVLEGFGFDVSHSMGNILFGERRLDSLPAVSSVCEALYKDQVIGSKLKSQNLWNLAQRRHLIVHRRSVVDAQYLSKSPDKMDIGHILSITSAEIDAYLCEVRDLGLLLCSAAASLV